MSDDIIERLIGIGIVLVLGALVIGRIKDE